jgi:hypothetical protein
MALFPRCNNPISVVGRHGTTLVGCHSCIQCRVAAQEHLCKILEVEASKHKYVEFLTLTYDDNLYNILFHGAKIEKVFVTAKFVNII